MGITVGQNTLSFFFSLHFIFPFIILILIILHIIYLHSRLSTNKIFIVNTKKKFIIREILLNKDLINIIFIFLFINIIFISPYFFDDEENSKLANDLKSPIHIKPE